MSRSSAQPLGNFKIHLKKACTRGICVQLIDIHIWEASMLTLKTQLTLPLLLRFRFNPQALPSPCSHFSAILIFDPAHLFLDQKEAPSFDFGSSTLPKSLFHLYENSSTSAKHKLSLPLLRLFFFHLYENASTSADHQFSLPLLPSSSLPCNRS